MKIEEAIETLEEKRKYCKMFYELSANPQEDYPSTAKFMDALELALTALRSMSEAGEYHFRDDTKLSLEQLKQMDGKPVWVVPLKKEDWDSHWDVMKHGCAIAESKTKPGKTYFLYEDSYRIRWCAYSYPPAHIDRSKWTAEWVNRMPILGAGDLETRCNSCGNLVLYETDFCPYCGKAMTEEAWAELERRLRG